MQTRYQSVFETTLDGIILITEEGIIEDINVSALQLFGYHKEELIGKNIHILMPSPHQENHDEYLRKYKKTQKASIIGVGRELEGKRKDNTLFPLHLGVTKFESDGKIYFAGAIHDLSTYKMQEAIIKSYSVQLEKRVADRTKKLEQEIQLKEIVQKALQASTKLFETIAENFPNGTIYVLDKSLNIIFVEGSDIRKRGPTFSWRKSWFKFQRYIPILLLVLGCLIVIRSMGLGVPYLSPTFDAEKVELSCCSSLPN